LAGHLQHNRAQINAHDLLDERKDEKESGPSDCLESTQAEDDGALVFAENLDAGGRHYENDDVDR
jgi:hypothetical protein